MQKLSLVCDALRNPKTLQFFTQVLEFSYSTHFTHAKAIRMMNESIHQLRQSQQPAASVHRLRKAGMYCHHSIYRCADNEWFMKQYWKYKSKDKVRYCFESIRKWILGDYVLDFGSGDGYFAHYLSSKGFSVWGTDVRDYRDPRMRDYSFSIKRQFDSMGPFQKKFDTTIVNSVLHHINPNSLDHVLSTIHRYTNKRVLIKEDILVTYIAQYTSEGSEMMQLFGMLNKLERMQYLGLMDFFGNFVVQGIFSMNLPLNFLSLEEWRDRLGKHNIKVRHAIPQLFSSTMVHTGPHAWLICDVN